MLLTQAIYCHHGGVMQQYTNCIDYWFQFVSVERIQTLQLSLNLDAIYVDKALIAIS